MNPDSMQAMTRQPVTARDSHVVSVSLPRTTAGTGVLWLGLAALVFAAWLACPVRADDPWRAAYASEPGSSREPVSSPMSAGSGHPEGPVDVWQLPAGAAVWSLPPQVPHRIITRPPLVTNDQQHRRAHQEKLGHPPIARIDGAAIQPVWRQPYAYGYFGASRNRHWQRHFGWSQAYTQWTLK